MSDLTDFAAHARKMAAAEHKPECKTLRRWTSNLRWDSDLAAFVEMTPRPVCPGCNPAKDRELFARLADEVDAYLRRDEAEDLFGETAVEPEVPC